MNKTSDARIPIAFGGQPAPTDAVLVEDGHDMPASGYAVRFALPTSKPSHAPGCACCTLRGPAADALTAMFQARARGTAPFFTRITVLASQAGQAAIRDTVATDVVSRARFRLLDDLGSQ